MMSAEDQNDQKVLAGAWKPLEANLGGNIIDAMLLETAKVVYEADKYTATVGEKTEQGSFTLDPKKTPKTMDIFPTSGDNNGKTLLAIYQVEGDNLTICYSLTPATRPEEFKPLSNTLLVVKFQRIKE